MAEAETSASLIKYSISFHFSFV